MTDLDYLFSKEYENWLAKFGIYFVAYGSGKVSFVEDDLETLQKDPAYWDSLFKYA